MICLSTDTIDDLILYLRSEEEHALDIWIEVLMIIFSMVARLISRLSYNSWKKLMIINTCWYDLQSGFQNLNSFL